MTKLGFYYTVSFYPVTIRIKITVKMNCAGDVRALRSRSCRTPHSFGSQNKRWRITRCPKLDVIILLFYIIKSKNVWIGSLLHNCIQITDERYR